MHSTAEAISLRMQEAKLPPKCQKLNGQIFTDVLIFHRWIPFWLTAGLAYTASFEHLNISLFDLSIVSRIDNPMTFCDGAGAEGPLTCI